MGRRELLRCLDAMYEPRGQLGDPCTGLPGVHSGSQVVERGATFPGAKADRTWPERGTKTPPRPARRWGTGGCPRCVSWDRALEVAARIAGIASADDGAKVAAMIRAAKLEGEE